MAAALAPFLYLVGGLCIIVGLVLHIPRDAYMPEDHDEG
jgi:hypothetical protein